MTIAREKQKILLENLLNRLQEEEGGSKYTLPGIITEEEREALRFANRLLQSDHGAEEVMAPDPSTSLDADAGRTKNHAPLRAPGSRQSVENLTRQDNGHLSSDGIEKLLKLDLLQSQTNLSSEVFIGIDFGTAYSKACMLGTDDESENIMELPLGIHAGEEALQMPVHSSLFLDTDGRLYFGPIAVEKSEERRSEGRHYNRVDSIKQFLIDEDRVTIDDRPLAEVFNPTDIEVPKAALIAFYLGYLMFLIRVAARDTHQIDVANVRYRVCLPCYQPAHKQKVMKEIAQLFQMGEVLGASFEEEWERGFRIEDVDYLFTWMRQNISQNSRRLDRFLEEPLAVAGSRLGRAGKSTGNVAMVVDVGAGTTDFSMFEIFADAGSGYFTARSIKDSEYGIPLAGDKLDAILLSFILGDASIDRSHERYREILSSLRLDIREYKERLFRSHRLIYNLPHGTSGEVKLDQFLETAQVRKFSSDLKKAFVQVLENIHASWLNKKILKANTAMKLPVILTGGGASLPMVKSLAKGAVEVKGQAIPLHLSPTVPEWIEASYEGEIIDLYPQMSASIGASKQFVIDSQQQITSYS